MNLKEFIGQIVIEVSRHGLDPLNVEIDCIDIGSVSQIDGIDVFVDVRNNQVTVHEGDGSCD